MKFILFVLLSLLISPLVYAKGSDVLDKVFGQEIEQMDYESMDKTPAGLLKYKEKMKEVHKYIMRLEDNALFSTTFTFKNPMTSEDLIDVIGVYEIMPSFVYVFAKDPQLDEIITLGFKTGSLESFEDDFVKTLESFERETGFDVLGITAILGYVPKQKIQISAKDDRMFLVDITADRRLSGKRQKHKHHFGWDLYHNQIK